MVGLYWHAQRVSDVRHQSVTNRIQASRAFTTKLANFSTGISKELAREEEIKFSADPESMRAKIETEVLDAAVSTGRKKNWLCIRNGAGVTLVFC